MAYPSDVHDSGQRARINQVEASLNYLAEGTEKPVTYAYGPPPGLPRTTRRNDPKTVIISDARPILGQLSLDTQGFVLLHHDSKVVNFYDDAEVREVYYSEVERLLKEATGAVKVVIFDHVVRCAPKARQGENGVREPAKIVHNDYSLKSGPRRVRDHVPEEAKELLQHRVAEINVWRAIRGPIQESPLAVCDAQSIELRDVVASDLVYPHRVGETMASARRREAEDPVGNRIFMDSYSFPHTAYRYRTWGKNDERPSALLCSSTRDSTIVPVVWGHCLLV